MCFGNLLVADFLGVFADLFQGLAGGSVQSRFVPPDTCDVRTGLENLVLNPRLEGGAFRTGGFFASGLTFHFARQAAGFGRKVAGFVCLLGSQLLRRMGGSGFGAGGRGFSAGFSRLVGGGEEFLFGLLKGLRELVDLVGQ